jgi:(1->4)-alpha-D-glucan 1-alpha-D-glucosylmutase
LQPIAQVTPPDAALSRPIHATYRLQLHPDFGFDDAAAIADYLSELGVSHAYCSPYLQAAPGSTHGYDVIAHDRVNAELGGAAAHDRLVAALTANALGQVLDIVPNHMAISTAANEWWADVLENGPSSHYAGYFDVEWAPPEARLRNTVLIPVLGDQYGRVLEAGELVVAREGPDLRLCYAEHRYPLDPRSIGVLIREAANWCGSDALAFVGDALAELPRPTATDRASVRRRHRDRAVLRRWLERVLNEDSACASALDQVVGDLNAHPDRLHELLEAQSYRLAWWRSASRDLGYRRFFDINTLIGLRMEDPQVFEDTHRLILDWARRGVLDGLRVDHPDGLRDPEDYCQRLSSAAPGKWIVLEKILEPGERLPASWPVAGTTGYDFLNRAFGVFVDPEGEAPLTTFYAEFTGQPTDYHALVIDRKLFVLREVLGSDGNRLTDLLLDIIERHPTHRDYSRHQLADVIRETVAQFPVYRTYVRPDTGAVTDTDRHYIEEAISGASARRPDLEPPLFDFMKQLLILEVEGTAEREFVARFQQLTGPAMAKGVEDTVFYLFNRFIALNEVGGDPSRFGLAVDRFHCAARETQQRWPMSMLATSTHDTKRGEDVRARLALLSEAPAVWIEAVRRWSEMTSRYRTGEYPDRNTEYLFYQTLVGASPLDQDRALAYLEKATREAKAHTSWTSPNEEYDSAVRRFIEGSLADSAFMGDVSSFVEPLVQPGWINALSQVLLKLTAPGVPDIYQGTELWSLHLVDPDNRRPVDYALRRSVLAEVQRLTAEEIWRRADEGLPKMWVVRQALSLRRGRPELFGIEGNYEPLSAAGACAAHVIAFMRGGGSITVVPRLVRRLGGSWQDTVLELPSGTWRDVFTDAVVKGVVPLSDLLGGFPVSLLEREP